MSSLSVQGVSKGFAGTAVLDGLDLTVPQQSITAILGPSGCGKTTLLRIIAGFLEPDSGTVRFGERVVVGDGRPVPAQQRRVGYVPQEGALFPHLTVAANITFGLRRNRRQARLSEMLELIELPARAGEMYPHELSGGQQQRVALARALAPEPAVVLLDEPFSSLDAALREGTGRSVVRALRTAGATAVLVTHDQSEALSLADQVGVMRDGRLIQVGTPTELYGFPVDPEVAEFVGGAALLSATLEGTVAHCSLGDVAVSANGASGQVQILVRPEQIVLQPWRAASTGIGAEVAEVSFYGHDAAVHLDLEPSGTRVVARVTGSEAPPVGSRVEVSVSSLARVFTP